MVFVIHIYNPRFSEQFLLQEGNEADEKDTVQEVSFDLQICLIIFCQREGVLWRGLQPLLNDAPLMIIQKATAALLDNFVFNKKKCNAPRKQLVDVNMRELAASVPRNFALHQPASINDTEIGRRILVNILLYPPQITYIQRLFTSKLIRYERLFLSLQCLSAYLATLGGGYFLCWHLENALKLAKYQRSLAVWMGDEATADKCTLNEAFNYIHFGLFTVAQKRIRTVQASASKRKDNSTLRIVEAAIIFLRRMKRLAKFERKMSNPTIDNFQRIRIVKPRYVK